MVVNPRYYILADRERTQGRTSTYWRDRLARAIADEAGRPASILFPRREPTDGRVRVGVVSPCCFAGGAERWISDLLDRCDGSRVRWDGIAIRFEADSRTGPSLRSDWETHAPVASGLDSIRDLARSVDVLLTWGVVDLPWGISGAEIESVVPPGLPLVTVSHGSTEYSGDPTRITRAVPVAVSGPALRGLPMHKRGDARIILNGVHPARVATTRTVAETRRQWGIPDGSKVAGYLGRFSAEKGFIAFVDGIAALPSGWIGVMAGAGHGERELRDQIDSLAPGRVRIIGHRDDVGDTLAGFDCLVMTSETEACSIAACEAWLAGCPLVSTSVGLLEDHPELARLIPQPATARSVADAILADESSPELRAVRVELARSFARSHLSMDRFGREWTDFIVSLAPKADASARPAGTQARLSVLRNRCEYGKRRPGCRCDDFDCSRDGAIRTRQQCYDCIEARLAITPATG